MKSKMNPRKKYANGTNSNGVGPNNYIQTPNEVLNDYNIMLAKAEAESLQNPWLPIVATAGGLIQQGISMAGSMVGGKATTTPDPSGASGAKGVMAGATAAMGMNDVQEDVEVEGGEMFETPQGEVGEFEGPSHEQGGIPLEVGQDVEEGTKVYSDRLKVGGKTLAERKEARERKIANLEKAASDKLVDVATKNALKRRMEAVQKEEASDLQFQEQVNNMQAMADTMVKAFGTGVEGIQKYPNGTGPQGIVYGKGYDESMFKDFFNQYQKLNPDGVMDMKYIQQDLGMNPTTKGFGQIFGPGSYKASQDWLAANSNKKPDRYVIGDVNEDGISDSLEKNPKINLEALQNFKVGVGVNDEISSSFADPSLVNGVPPGTIETPFSAYNQKVNSEDSTTATGKKESKFMKALGDNMPTTGDMTKLIGNYLGMTAGMKNAAESRSTDITHTNVYKDAGKESQKLLDNAKASIEGQKAQAIIKASTTSRGGKKGARGSARGVNQMRAMDWLYDTALNQQIAEISANAAGQLSQIDVQKSGVAMNADQLKGQGEYQAAMANEAAKDAYYTALGLGKKDFATGMQQTGADLNDMRQNKILETLLGSSGEYVGMTKKGKMYGKPVEVAKTKKEADSKGELKLEVDAAGNKFIMISGKKVIIKD